MSSDVELPLTPISPLVRPTQFVTLTISRFYRIWPVPGLGLALIVNVAWLGFLGFDSFSS